jgi:hypothetical protein
MAGGCGESIKRNRGLGERENGGFVGREVIRRKERIRMKVNEAAVNGRAKDGHLVEEKEIGSAGSASSCCGSGRGNRLGGFKRECAKFRGVG